MTEQEQEAPKTRKTPERQGWDVVACPPEAVADNTYATLAAGVSIGPAASTDAANRLIKAHLETSPNDLCYVVKVKGPAGRIVRTVETIQRIQ